MCLLPAVGVPHLPLPNSVAFLAREEVLAIADDAPPVVALIFSLLFASLLLSFEEEVEAQPFSMN